MKRWIAMLLTLLALTGCAADPVETTEESEYGLWFAVSRNSVRDNTFAIAREDRVWNGQPTARQLMDALLKGPEGEGMYRPFPSGVSVRSITMDEKHATLRVDMSEQYGGLAGYDLTVADSCIAMTLCQLPDVEHVEVLVAGEPIPYRNRQQIGSGDIFISDMDEQPQNRLVTLYFPCVNGEGLVAEYRHVAYTGGQAVEILMDELLQGPTEGTEGVRFPLGTQVLDLNVANGVCQVNLSREFLNGAQQDEQKALANLYAIVNSLCTLSGVGRVRILIEGESPESYAGMSLKSALTANYDLLR